MRLGRRSISLCRSSLLRPAICLSTSTAPLTHLIDLPVGRRRSLPSSRHFASAAVHTEVVPGLGDSVSEGTLNKWLKNVGDSVKVDEVIASLETDKVSMDIRSHVNGKIVELLVKEGSTVKVGDALVKISPEGGAASAPKEAPKETKQAPKAEAPKAEAPKAEAKKAESSKAESSKAESSKAESSKAESPKAESPKAEKKETKAPAPQSKGLRTERREPLSRMRRTIAKRLKDSQNVAAMLTTFNEIDMHNLMELRNKYKEEFEKTHKSKLGFMSAFVKASTFALQKFPAVNAYMDLDAGEVIYRDYVDISVAVGTPTGLVVPVLRNTENMSFNDVEATINTFGQKARKGQLAMEDMVGGTFTISNGGVYGSLFGTPIINPPQSAILGMHGIFKRPVVVNDQIVIRPMMYVALTYDHRMIDGSTAVTFLKTIKNAIEDPQRLLLDL